MEAVADGSASKFSAGERVYVPHTDKYYEAKILKSEYRWVDTLLGRGAVGPHHGLCLACHYRLLC